MILSRITVHCVSCYQICDSVGYVVEAMHVLKQRPFSHTCNDLTSCVLRQLFSSTCE